MSDERANNWARRPRTSDIFKRKTRMMNRKLELHNNPSSHNNDQRYKNGIDLGRDKGRKKEGEEGKSRRQMWDFPSFFFSAFPRWLS